MSYKNSLLFCVAGHEHDIIFNGVSMLTETRRVTGVNGFVPAQREKVGFGVERAGKYAIS